MWWEELPGTELQRPRHTHFLVVFSRKQVQNVKVKQAKRLASQTADERREQYARVTEAIGQRRLEELEASLREKLFNRVAAGPFQLRRNFKYFDKDGNGTIDVDEFSECLEYLMGVILPEDHVIALFARYDDDASGTMEYPEFIQKLMGECRTPDPSWQLESYSSTMGNLSVTYWRPASPPSGAARPATSPEAPRNGASWRRAVGGGKGNISGSGFCGGDSLEVISHRPRRAASPPDYHTPPPHHPLHGSEEDSRNSCRLSLVPRPRIAKLPTSAPAKRVFRARFARPSREDACRQFEVSLFVDDHTLSVFEPPRRNSGVLGGKFLLRHRFKTPEGKDFTPDMFLPGAVLRIGGHDFKVF